MIIHALSFICFFFSLLGIPVILNFGSYGGVPGNLFVLSSD